MAGSGSPSPRSNAPGAKPTAAKVPAAVAPAASAEGASSPSAPMGSGERSRSGPVITASPVPPPITTTSPVPASGKFPGLELAQEPPFRWPSPRAPIALFLMLVLLGGVIYPGAMTLLAAEIAPVSSEELFTLVGENISNPALFWERPSQINWSAIYGAGDEAPYGPENPLLLNQTLQYIQMYGLGNVTVPLDLVSPSGSGLDPDIYPDAALIQVPRVVHFSNLSLDLVWGLVNDSIIAPEAGIAGPYYVNVILLDQTLLTYLPPGTPVVEGG